MLKLYQKKRFRHQECNMQATNASKNPHFPSRPKLTALYQNGVGCLSVMYDTKQAMLSCND